MIQKIIGISLVLLVLSCGSGEILDCVDGCSAEAAPGGGSPHEQIDALKVAIEGLQELIQEQSVILGEQAERLADQEETIQQAREREQKQTAIIEQLLFQEEVRKEILCDY